MPVLDRLDDLIQLALGIASVIRVIPSAIITECRERAQDASMPRYVSRLGAIAVVMIWIDLAT